MPDITKNIGKKVKANHHLSYRVGETAVIIGCCLRDEDNKPQYIIKFKDGEYDTIPARELFNQNGFVIVE